MTLNLIPVMISGVGYCVPETVITNDDLTKLVETSDEWITTRFGIKERRVVSGEETAVSLGIKAAEKALKNAKMKLVVQKMYSSVQYRELPWLLLWVG